MRSLSLLAFCSILLLPGSLFAYTTHRATLGPLTMYFGTNDRLAKQEKITKLDEPLTLTAVIENKGDTPLAIQLEFSTIETLEFFDKGEGLQRFPTAPLLLPAGKTAVAPIKVVAKPGTYTAHYPVRLDAKFQLDGKPVSAHIIQVVETQLPGSATAKNPLLGQTITDAKQLPLNTLPNSGGLALATLDTYRGVWNYDNKPAEILPVGFQGNESTSSASMNRQPMTRGGVSRQSLNMHPPYRGGIGNVGMEYRMKLPETKPISLSFFSAMRDVVPPEPPTDGVTYRVKVDGKTVYEKHDAKNDWVAHEADLSAFAGKEIMLTLESDPGPKRNTTCDSCYWGDVILFAGEKPAVLTAEAKQKLFAENLQAVKTGKSESPKTQVFSLDGGLTGAVTFGENGFIDGVIGVGNAEKQVQFDGLRVWVKGQPIGASPSAISCGAWGQTADSRRQTAAEGDTTIERIPVGNKLYTKSAPQGAQDLAQGNALGNNAATTPAALQGQENDSALLPLTGRQNAGRDSESQGGAEYRLPWARSDALAGRGENMDRDFELAGGKLWSQEINVAERKEHLIFGIKQTGPALQFILNAPEDDLIDRIEFGPATHHASRVYFGHGYCISEPESFTINAGGHTLSTSHVGMDFDNGLSVLQASSFPPDRFIVAPTTKRYTLSVHPGTTITLLPGTAGALDCAIRFRPLHETKPSPGVAAKAGRFVFDIWGGRYKEHTETIKLAEKYGLTDALFIVHNWQRYGYDDRLPDIFPPSTRLGTLEEMQETLKLCDSLGIQYGVHDNYIDFYPDADEYNFDVTTFMPNGQPRPAWNNYGIEAQSYQFRPDHVQRFLERNLEMIVPELPMSTYFVDVFTSIPPIDYYDRDGKFHSRVEAQKHWNKAFDTIRDRLSAANKNFPSATTSSEAGMDSLIGHLDGADCQFMFISPSGGEHTMQIKCKEWSRVPWFDAVHHTKFSMHGVGYSSRYEAQRGRALHGIESDDYITSEILTGHALMVDHGSWRRGAVRKYWLAQDLIRYLADKEIVNVQFYEGNIQRQVVEWSDGTTVLVNLGKDDWTISSGQDFVLPQYGFYAKTPRGNSVAMLKRNGQIVEWALGNWGQGVTHYVNARQKGVEGLLPITPTLNSFKYLGENQFTATFKWNAKEPAPKDLCVFVHGVERRQNWYHKPNEAVFGGAFPTVPTSQWNGEVITDNHTGKNAEGQPVMSIPDDLPAGRYYLVVGLYDANGRGQRAKLVGFNADSDRYVVGWLNVQRRDGKVSNITMEPFEWDEAELYERLLPPKEPVEFSGFGKTKGGFKASMPIRNTMILTPLPDEPATEVALRTLAVVKSVKAIDEAGKELRDVPFVHDDNAERPIVTFTTQLGEFAYKIVW